MIFNCKPRYLFAIGAAFLLGQHPFLHAQVSSAPSLNYNISVSPLPLQVGQPVTLTVAVPSTVPDGTRLTIQISPHVYTDPGGFFGVATVSKGMAVIQTPAFTAPGQYDIDASSGSSGFGAGEIALLVSPTGQTPDPLLTFTGQYSFSFQGQTGTAAATSQTLIAAGSFTADGKGNITAGTLDLNGGGLLMQNTAVKGTYALDATGSGTALLATPQGSLSFHFVVPPAAPGFLVQNGAIVSSGGVTGSGDIARVGNFLDFSAFFYPEVGTINAAVDLSEKLTAQSGLSQEAGQLTFSQDMTVTSTGFVNAGASGSPFLGLTGTYTSADPTTGRFTMTLSAPGQMSAAPSHYAVYQISPASLLAFTSSATTLRLVSLDPPNTAALIAGKAIR